MPIFAILSSVLGLLPQSQLIRILGVIVDGIPGGVDAFHQVKATMSEHDQTALVDQLNTARAARHAADDALDAVLRAKGM